MLIVGIAAKSQQAHFVQRDAIKAICGGPKLLRKAIRSEATEFRYEHEKQSPLRHGTWRDKFGGMLMSNEWKRSRERLTLIRVFEEQHKLRYTGDVVWCIRLAKLSSGEVYQFD